MSNVYEEFGRARGPQIFNVFGLKIRFASKKLILYCFLFVSFVTFLIIYKINRTDIDRNVLVKTELPYEHYYGNLQKADTFADALLPKNEERLSNYTLEGYSNVSELVGPVIRMDDPRLVAQMREKYLLSPPHSNVRLNLSNPWLYDTSMGQSTMIREILKYKRNGFYIECGALDGETRSNSLVFERLYNWTGLLIEADPLNYEEAVYKRRRAYLSQSCLSVKPYPMIVSFEQASNMGKISDYPSGFDGAGHVDVRCFPLYTYLLALNRTVVDYFSLDVEGSELEVLENIPFDKVDIRTLSVEFIHGARGKDVLRTFMEQRGYQVYGEVTHFDNLANDFIFVKKPSPASR